MNEVHLEPKVVVSEEENEKDPLAFEEEETDPLAVQPATVKTEPDVEPDPVVSIEAVNLDKPLLEDNHDVIKDTDKINGKPEIEEVNVDEAKMLEPLKELETPLVPKQPNENIVAENKCPSRKCSTEQMQGAPFVEPITMDSTVDNENIKAETNGTLPNAQLYNSKMNGSTDKPDCYEKFNGNVQTESTRKRSPGLLEPQTPSKKLCTEVTKSYIHHDNMINDYIQSTTKNGVDDIQRHTEQLLSEIETLKELAQKKELEWNNILHLKKVKEEILLRLLRRKQVLAFEKLATVNGTDRATETVDLTMQSKNFVVDKNDEVSGLSIKPKTTASVATQSVSLPMPPPAHSLPHYASLPAPPPYDKPIIPSTMSSMSKPPFSHPIAMQRPSVPMFGMDFSDSFMARYNSQMGRQGPVMDVKSIIADYRQRNPETVPRRGRRMKSMNNPQGASCRSNTSKMDSLNNLGMLLNNMDLSQKSILERLTQGQAGSHNGSFKDILMHFAQYQQQTTSMQAARPTLDNLLNQTQRQSDAVTVSKLDKECSRTASERPLIEAHKASEPRPTNPPPYPEISLHPVVTSSNSEQAQQNSSLLHGILTKNCGEITITPVQPKNKEPPAPSDPPAPTQVVQMQEDEESGGGSEESGEGEGGARLVIDEGGAEVPLCQGCRRRDAQFVCAGCANQWYCSRECQVAAWDDHSEMCSG